MKIKKAHFFQAIFFLAYLICFNSLGTRVFAFTPGSETECTAAGGYCGASCDAEDRVAVGTCGSTGANRTCCYPKTPSESSCTSITCEGSSDKGTCSSNFNCPSGKTPFGLCGDAAYCCVPTSCKAVIPNPPGVETNPTNVSSTKDCESLQCGDGSAGKCIDSTTSCSMLGNKKSVGTCDGPNTQCCAAYNCSTTPVQSSTQATTDSATASLNYKTLENLPGFENLESRKIEGCDDSNMFCKYLKSLYLLALWIVGICALFMLVLGGFLYLSSAGNTALISSAKKTITGALIGLVIALITWLILNTINPSLTTIDLNSLSLSGGGTTTGSTGGPTTPAGDTSTCESIKSQVNQCADASSGLLAALGCMAEKLGNQNFTISSISDNAGFLTCQQSWTDAKCAHAQNSCHYGGSAKNPKSCAADISLSSKASQSDIRAAAKACNVAHFDVHGTPLHIHISTNECGCDNGLPTP